MRLQGKTALVTGAAGGIGRGIVERLASEGADIVAAVHKANDAAEEAAQAVRATGRRAWVVAGDLSSATQAADVVERALAVAGSLHIIVNNAGIEIRAPFADITESDYDRVLDTNLKGPFFLTQAFVRHLREAGRGGKVINISSVHEDLPFPHFTSYCVSKGGLRMLMRNLAIELAPFGITVNNIAPGAIQTPINRTLSQDQRKLSALIANVPLGRLGQPADVAAVAAFLASDDADYMTGTTVYVDGGLLRNYAEQ